MTSTPKLKFALLVSLALTGICSAQLKQTSTPGDPSSNTTDALLNSPPVVPLDQAADFSLLNSSWNLSAGYQWRQIGALDFHTGSKAAKGGLPWLTGQGRRGSASSSSSSTSSSGTPVTTSTSSTTTGSNANTGTAGPVDSFADRTYDDGYVNRDEGTLEPGPYSYGKTWFWGYNNAGQINRPTLTYHVNAPGTTTTTTTTAMGGGTDTTKKTTSTTSYAVRHSSWSGLSNDLDWDSQLSGSGWFARVESPAIFTRDALAVSMEIGYSFANADTGRSNGGVFGAQQGTEQLTSKSIKTSSLSTTTTGTGSSTTTIRVINSITDTYDVSAFLEERASNAPYSGTLMGPGTQISNIPDSRVITSATTSETTGTTPTSTSTTTSSNKITPGGASTRLTTVDFFSNVTESLDIDLHTASIGPHFSWEMRRVRVGLSTGLALNIASWNADYYEDLFVKVNGHNARLLAAYHESNGGTKLLPGFYLEANSNVTLTRRVSLFAGGRYDWAGSLHGNVGPSNFSLDLGGWTAQGGITIAF
jgi:hypothetical protein